MCLNHDKYLSAPVISQKNTLYMIPSACISPPRQQVTGPGIYTG